jgi:hypothetical protein
VALLAVLLIVLGAAIAGLLAIRLDSREQVLVARRDISAGQQIAREDLAVTRVAADGIRLVPSSQAGDVVGRYATGRIAAGRLIDPLMLAGSGLLTPTTAAVGMALAPGRYPASGLESGDVVQVVRTVDGSGRVISGNAVVGSVSTPADGVFGGDGGDTTVVTVVVPRGEAPDVAAAASADQVSLVLLSRGTALDGAALDGAK